MRFEIKLHNNKIAPTTTTKTAINVLFGRKQQQHATKQVYSSLFPLICVQCTLYMFYLFIYLLHRMKTKQSKMSKNKKCSKSNCNGNSSKTLTTTPN